MPKTVFFLFAILAVWAPLAAAETAVYELDAAGSKLTFGVDSTLHAVEGRAQAMIGRVRFDRRSGRTVSPFEIEIPVRSLETGNAKRDRAMLKMFDEENHPLIRWQASSVICEPASAENEQTCRAEGRLKIRGVENGSRFPVTLHFDESGVEAQGQWSFERREFDLKTPSVLGIIRVAQLVSIHFKTRWVEEPTP